MKSISVSSRAGEWNDAPGFRVGDAPCQEGAALIAGFFIAKHLFAQKEPLNEARSARSLSLRSQG
jgi:hypothetical protein